MYCRFWIVKTWSFHSAWKISVGSLLSHYSCNWLPLQQMVGFLVGLFPGEVCAVAFVLENVLVDLFLLRRVALWQQLISFLQSTQKRWKLCQFIKKKNPQQIYLQAPQHSQKSSKFSVKISKSKLRSNIKPRVGCSYWC